MRKKTKAELESELAVRERSLFAMREWFTCESKGHATQELTVNTGSTSARPLVPTVRVVVHGMTRAAGGVCVVESDGHREFPVHLDDLCSDWAKDSSKEIRDAAALLLRRRDEQLSLGDRGLDAAAERVGLQKVAHLL